MRGMPGRAALLAFAETLAMPFVLLAWGLSTLGCGSWVLFMAFMLPLIGGSTMGWWVIAWTCVAVPAGFWNCGQFMNYFHDADRKAVLLGKVALVSGGLIISHPLTILTILN